MLINQFKDERKRPLKCCVQKDLKNKNLYNLLTIISIF